jgi:hypothetical protein
MDCWDFPVTEISLMEMTANPQLISDFESLTVECDPLSLTTRLQQGFYCLLIYEFYMVVVTFGDPRFAACGEPWLSHGRL